MPGNYPQEIGVLQGSVLSVTLSITKIFSNVTELAPTADSFLYVDDFLRISCSRYMDFIMSQLQLTSDNSELRTLYLYKPSARYKENQTKRNDFIHDMKVKTVCRSCDFTRVCRNINSDILQKRLFVESAGVARLSLSC